MKVDGQSGAIFIMPQDGAGVKKMPALRELAWGIISNGAQAARPPRPSPAAFGGTPSLNFGFLPTAPPHGAPGRFRGPKKKIVFHCGGFAAAMKNIFFMFFLPCWGGFRRFPRRRPEKAKLQGDRRGFCGGRQCRPPQNPLSTPSPRPPLKASGRATPRLARGEGRGQGVG